MVNAAVGIVAMLRCHVLQAAAQGHCRQALAALAPRQSYRNGTRGAAGFQHGWLSPCRYPTLRRLKNPTRGRPSPSHRSEPDPAPPCRRVRAAASWLLLLVSPPCAAPRLPPAPVVPPASTVSVAIPRQRPHRFHLLSLRARGVSSFGRPCRDAGSIGAAALAGAGSSTYIRLRSERTMVLPRQRNRKSRVWRSITPRQHSSCCC